MKLIVKTYDSSHLYGDRLKQPMYKAIDYLPKSNYRGNVVRAIGALALMILALPIYLLGLGISAIHYHMLKDHLLGGVEACKMIKLERKT